MVFFGRFKPEDPKTEGMIATARMNALEMLDEIFEVWEPSHQTWLLNNSGKVAGTVAALPAIYLSLRFRRLFGFHHNAKPGDVLMYLPIIPMAGFFAQHLHTSKVRNDIVLQETECSVCVDIRSSAIQFTAGVIIPTGMAYFSTLMMARTKNVRMYPKNFAAFKVLTNGLFAKIYAPLFAIAVIQLGLSAYLVSQLYTDRDTVMGELEARYNYEQQLMKRLNIDKINF